MQKHFYWLGLAAALKMKKKHLIARRRVSDASPAVHPQAVKKK